MNSKTFFKAIMWLVGIAVFVFLGIFLYSSSSGSAGGSIYASSLASTSSRPTLSGTAFGTDTVQLTVFRKGSGEKVYISGNVNVIDGKWTTNVSEELGSGTYDVVVTSAEGVVFNNSVSGMLVVSSDTDISVATSTPVVVVSAPIPPATKPTVTSETTTVVSSVTSPSVPPPTTSGVACPVGFTCTLAGGTTTVTSTTTTTTTNPTTAPITSSQPTSAATTLVVSSVPLLQGGKTEAKPSVQISYLQITNIGNVPAHLRGFTVRQNGSASTDAIANLTTVDDKGGSTGTSSPMPFINGSAFAPTDAVFAPGQMRLFTIRAVLNPNITPYIGSQLMIDVSSVDTNAVTVQGAFPIRGTTWTIGY